MKKRVIFVLVIVILLIGSAYMKAEPGKEIKVTILYDNYIHKEGTKSDWGFACLVEGTEKSILFDTGTKPDILLHNIEKLGLQQAVQKAELVVISHEHYDHIGGLWTLLGKNHQRRIFVPVSLPRELVEKIETSGAKPVKVTQSQEVCKNVYLTGEMGTEIKEHSLILDTDKGLILITGCSHPGIVEIVGKATEIGNKKVYCAFGGFHLFQSSPDKVAEIAGQLKALGVQKIGATHCTGDDAIAILKKEFGKRFIHMGVGKVLSF